MTRRISLLERLAQARGARSTTLVEDRSAVMRSVLRNLQQVLNTRQGSAAAQLDLGIPSPHEMLQGFPATLDSAQQSIRRCILKYEPRLANVIVRHQRNEGQATVMDFQISAQLAGGDGSDPVSFTTSLTQDGRLRLRDG